MTDFGGHLNAVSVPELQSKAEDVWISFKINQGKSVLVLGISPEDSIAATNFTSK